MRLQVDEFGDLNPALVAESLRVARRCRAALDIIWPLWRDGHNFPAPEPGETMSDGACIHSAFMLEAMLKRDVPGIAWEVAGGHPSSRLPSGGCRHLDGTFVRQHVWVVGAPLSAPGAHAVLVDVTADQFGRDRVLLEATPVAGYLANSPASMLQAFRVHEAETVKALLELPDAMAHLFG